MKLKSFFSCAILFFLAAMVYMPTFVDFFKCKDEMLHLNLSYTDPAKSDLKETNVDSEMTAQIEDVAVGGDEKPYLVFHVGPPKTATTTLQTELSYFKEELEKDEYFYAGRYYNPHVNNDGKVIINRSGSEIEKLAHAMFNLKLCSPFVAACTDNFKQELDKQKSKGQHILISDEAYANNWKNPQAFQIIKEVFAPDWNVVIVVGYRHFYDWMPSELFQRYRMDHAVGRSNNWPGIGIGEVVEMVFPNLVYTWPTDKCDIFTTHVMQNVNDTLPLHILDLHQTKESESLRSHFLCNVLPKAPKACKESRRQDLQTNVTVMNSSDQSRILHVFYDMVTTTATAKGLIDQKQYNRSSIREDMREHNEYVLNQSAMDLDLACPDQEQQDYYVTVSLGHQRQIYGEAMTAEMEESHRQGFQEKIDSQAFCWVDADAVLERQVWQEFFAKYAPRESKKKPSATGRLTV